MGNFKGTILIYGIGIFDLKIYYLGFYFLRLLILRYSLKKKTIILCNSTC